MSNKVDLSGLKSKLESIEGEFESKLKEVENKESKFQRMDKQIDELLSKNDSVVKLNVGGKIFQTKLSTLLSQKDSLFCRIANNYAEKNEQITEIFFDRSYTYFPKILDYLRTKKISVKGMRKIELDDFEEECKYYGIDAVEDIIAELKKEVEFVSFESSGRYSTAGTHKVEDLKNPNMMGGICVQSPYYIIIELNFEHEFEKIEIGGWNGNSSLWYAGNGANAQILTSTDKSKWTDVGKIPSNLGASIQTVTLKRSIAKYIKFQHNSYVGIGYLKIHRYTG
jgi:uncharacterized protein YdcH (DUF465 family)